MGRENSNLRRPWRAGAIGRTQMRDVRSMRATVSMVAAVVLLMACAVEKPTIEVWKSASCGCCIEWVRHLQNNGFRVRTHDVDDPALHRAKHGIPEHLGSCHTAAIAGYALEGHVPPSEIRRLLSERPAAIGLAVPAMPIGSPGMDGPEYRGRKDPYDVLLVVRGFEPRIFQSYR